MRISYLKEFYTLSEYLNFSGAAEALHISQPVLSRHITALEDSMDTKLFHRTTKSVSLTQAGEILKNAVPQIISSFDGAFSAINTLREKPHTELRLGLPAVPANDYLNNIPSQFQAQYPQTRLSYHFGDPEENISRLISKQLDIILVANIPFPGSEFLRFVDYDTEPLIVIMRADEPLAKKSALHLTDLSDYSFVTNDSYYYRVIWEKFVNDCKWIGFIPREALCVKQIGNVLAGVREKKGVAIVGKHHSAMITNNLCYRPILDACCYRRLSVACLASDSNPAVEDFIKLYAKMTSKASKDPSPVPTEK